MPTRRPQRPISARVIADTIVADPTVSRALGEVGQAVREQQRDPALPREVAKGDMFYVDSNGRLVRLAAGVPGQTLKMGADGVPEWVT